MGRDNVRRTVLRERGAVGGADIGLIDPTARYVLGHGFHVVVEGVLYADRYGDMLTALVADHRGVSRCFYLDVPFGVTVERHATGPEAAEYGAESLRRWWRSRDLLPGGVEEAIGGGASLEEGVARIMESCGWGCRSAPRE
ncbi:hypothetical protein SUDANB121_05471 [Nocardiopsis dassonvillei]|uniref:kinase n=1 Tax=Nocardiopsis dassonvillei TaxID=2014 RepID=UPI003F54CFCC